MALREDGGGFDSRGPPRELDTGRGEMLQQQRYYHTPDRVIEEGLVAKRGRMPGGRDPVEKAPRVSTPELNERLRLDKLRQYEKNNQQQPVDSYRSVRIPVQIQMEVLVQVNSISILCR
jgi:hypothetical protein